MMEIWPGEQVLHHLNSGQWRTGVLYVAFLEPNEAETWAAHWRRLRRIGLCQAVVYDIWLLKGVQLAS